MLSLWSHLLLAAYEKLAALTDRTYLFGNDLGATH